MEIKFEVDVEGTLAPLANDAARSGGIAAYFSRTVPNSLHRDIDAPMKKDDLLLRGMPGNSTALFHAMEPRAVGLETDDWGLLSLQLSKQLRTHFVPMPHEITDSIGPWLGPPYGTQHTIPTRTKFLSCFDGETSTLASSQASFLVNGG
jgi:hypothetical protein